MGREVWGETTVRMYNIWINKWLFKNWLKTRIQTLNINLWIITESKLKRKLNQIVSLYSL